MVSSTGNVASRFGPETGVARLTHDLANALAVATARLSVLADRDLPEAIATEVRSSLEQLERAREIVRQLSHAGRRGPRAAVSLQGSWRRASSGLEAAGLRVETRCEVENPLVLASSIELETLLTSVAATELESLRGISGTALIAEIRKAKDRIVFLLRSSAPPFSRETLGRLFDPFFLRKPEGLGDGIGFAVCRKIAESYDGSFAVSRTANGREYRLELPAAQPVGQASRSAAARPCLVVDDERRVRESCALMLRHLGYAMEMAPSGTEALERIRNGTFCAILLDLHLGNPPDGSEVIGEIRRSHPELLRRTIIATGDPGNPSVEAMARELGVAVLAKPFGVAELRRALENASGDDRLR